MIKKENTLLNDKELLSLLNTNEWVNVELTKEEWKPLIGITSIECFYQLKARELISNDILPTLIKLKVKCKVGIIDDFTNKVEEEKYNGEEEILLSSENDEDIVDMKNGLIDIRPSFLAILYSIIPLCYSKDKIDKISIDGVTIMSEEEYRKSKVNNPFSDINLDDFED